MRKETLICTIGGGSGMPVINKALVAAGFKNVRSVVTTFDSGGDSGRMRTDERGGILAFSDYWRSLISLWKDGQQKENWEEMLRFRDGRGRNFGNIFFQFMAERVGNLSEVDNLFSRLTGAHLNGEVVPVSTQPANVCFETASGRQYCGEHFMDGLRMSKDMVKKVWLEPKVEATKRAMEVIEKSEVIIICPGSLYGSVITNFLPKGIVAAYRKSKAKKVLMTNIMSVANESHDFSQNDYVSVFADKLKIESPFDLVVMVNLQKLDKRSMAQILKYYEMENSFPLKFEEKERSWKTIVADIGKIEKKNMRLRHDEKKVGKFFAMLEF